MDGIIHQTLLFLFFTNLPVIIHSKNINSCPNSTCKSLFLPLKYPFKLETDIPPRHCQYYINLRCNDQGQATINLPSYGDFYVTYIDYDMQKIVLSDPENCLPRRLMTNFPLSPLEAFQYENYTYYTCPREILRYRFSEIECLSNSTNATIATTGFSTEYMEEWYGCRPIVSSMIPVLSTNEYDYLGILGDLRLTWNVPACKDCEELGITQSTGDSKSKWTKFVIPSAVVLVTFFGIACLLRLMKLMIRRNNTNNTTATNPPTDSAAVAPPQPTGETSAPPSGTTNGTPGIENSNLKSCTELVVLSEGQGRFLASGMTCPICIEEYHGKETVRYLPVCGHYFHAECVDQWLQKNTTCPVCRTSLSDFI